MSGNQQIWRDINTDKTYLIDSNNGAQKKVQSNGQNLKKYKPGITGFVNAHTRKRIVGKEKEGLHSLGITLNHYVPQPNKFEGYSSFPRPVSRPYVNKAEFFKMNVLKKPKGLKQDKFLSIKNKSMNRKDENYKSNNVGTTFLTAKRAQSQNNKTQVIKDFESSKLVKSAIADEDPSFSKGKKMIINKMITLRKAISKNSEREIHGRTLKQPLNQTITNLDLSKTHTSFSRAGSLQRRDKMSITTYGSNFGNPPKSTTSQNMYTSQRIPKFTQLRLRTADPTKTAYTSIQGKRTGIMSTKFSPKKLKPFLEYSLHGLRGSPSNILQKMKDPSGGLPKTGKDPKGAKVEETIKKPDEGSLLLENLSESSEGDTQFRVNNIAQEEIEANMFTNPPPVRQKNSVKPRMVFTNAIINTMPGQFKIDRIWKVKSNPMFQQQESEYILKDKKMLEKRRYGKVLKNMALQRELEITSKKIEKEYKKRMY
ncbi:unnamed protein product [Moneuplotes crassus]|uniref:Uncharacterized protein n=1 Tax=Euplotes crassus TaxID=5936 RepID=A0AAD1XCM8_EUPCR|nr:unnamed protein product [Moneuplotes crassus]